jgi:hypothetical protein
MGVQREQPGGHEPGGHEPAALGDSALNTGSQSLTVVPAEGPSTAARQLPSSYC